MFNFILAVCLNVVPCSGFQGGDVYGNIPSQQECQIIFKYPYPKGADCAYRSGSLDIQHKMTSNFISGLVVNSKTQLDFYCLSY